VYIYAYIYTGVNGSGSSSSNLLGSSPNLSSSSGGAGGVGSGGGGKNIKKEYQKKLPKKLKGKDESVINNNPALQIQSNQYNPQSLDKNNSYNLQNPDSNIRVSNNSEIFDIYESQDLSKLNMNTEVSNGNFNNDYNGNRIYKQPQSYTGK
jgi:hypothetical protein